MTGKVVAIFTAPLGGRPLRPVQEATLEAGRGIVGDRYYEQTGTFSAKLKDDPDREVTLIEQEEVERFNESRSSELDPSSFRRNILTRGIRLNELVGHRFRVGSSVLEGVRLCEPCAYLAELLDPAVVKGMAHRAGLRARIVSGSVVRPGDDIEIGTATTHWVPDFGNRLGWLVFARFVFTKAEVESVVYYGPKTPLERWLVDTIVPDE